jgi:hypothetical protein
LWEDPAGDDALLGWALLDPNGETFDLIFAQTQGKSII